MEVIYVPKEELYPAFGLCTKTQIKIREDLPSLVKGFVWEHEQYHSTDKETNWIMREIKANLYAFVAEPIGGVMAIFMSLAPYRLKMYWNRFKEGR